jgi:hypothetical protein
MLTGLYSEQVAVDAIKAAVVCATIRLGWQTGS